MKVIEIRQSDDETMQIYVADNNPGGYDKQIVTITHDANGWEGMDLAEELLEKVGLAFGIQVVDRR